MGSHRFLKVTARRGPGGGVLVQVRVRVGQTEYFRPVWFALVRFGFRLRVMLVKRWLGAHRDSLAEWSKALASGASPQGRGFEPHSCHHVDFPTARDRASLAIVNIAPTTHTHLGLGMGANTGRMRLVAQQIGR